MTTATASIATFILDRVADDEAAARAATPGPWFTGRSGAVSAAPDERDEYGDLMGNAGPPVMHASFEENGPANGAHIARHDPARVLAECAAKRAIVEEYEEIQHTLVGLEEEGDWEAAAGWVDRKQALDFTLRALASIWADDPGFQEAWR